MARIMGLVGDRRLIEGFGGKVVILPGVPGRSTSSVLAKIAKG